MDNYLALQQSTIFQHVGVMIYVFEVESRNMAKDLQYYRECLAALQKYSPSAAVFLLVHKMDLARGSREQTLERKARELQQASDDVPVTVFGTSIYDESLYKVRHMAPHHLSHRADNYYQAWSRIVHTLIPNAAVLSKHLTTLAHACSATEVILFERTTFLVIATSAPPPTPPSDLTASVSPAISSSSSPQTNGLLTPTFSQGSLPARDLDTDSRSDPHKLSPTRYERTSELIKAFKHACSRVREEFHSLEMELDEFTAVLDELTKNTYVLIVVHDPTIGA